MLKDKEKLENFLNQKTENIVFDTKLCEEIRNYMLEKYNIPTGATMDMIAQRVSLKEKNEFILFCLLDGIDYVKKQNYKNEYYTDIEIEQYTHTKLETDKIKFPLKIKCDQVSSDQWIGAIDTKFFMDLRKNQLIRYNANAQRVMKRIIKGENILFKLIPNKAAIKAIRSLIHNNIYIPTTITLNIPYNSDVDFYFDNEKRILVINNIQHFDISDGYHRYLAICEEGDTYQEFNYPMEIRITNFGDEKVRQFIFQEDQKTKMSKTNSKSMDMNRSSNAVVDRLNESTTFNLKGQIGRNDGTVNYASLSDLIEYFYFKEKKVYTNIDIMNVVNDVKQKLNALTEYKTDYMNMILGLKELTLIFYVFDIESDINKACKIIDDLISSGVHNKINMKPVSKGLFNPLKQIL